jgi:hypothetical protein
MRKAHWNRYRSAGGECGKVSRDTGTLMTECPGRLAAVVGPAGWNSSWVRPLPAGVPVDSPPGGTGRAGERWKHDSCPGTGPIESPPSAGFWFEQQQLEAAAVRAHAPFAVAPVAAAAMGQKADPGIDTTGRKRASAASMETARLTAEGPLDRNGFMG